MSLRLLLYGAAALLQIVLIGYMVFDRAQVLRTGADVTLRTEPVDPRDLLRGDYVVLFYEISRLPAGSLQGTPAMERHGFLYVTLAPQPDGFYNAASLDSAPRPVRPGEVLLRGRVKYGADCGARNDAYCDVITLDYGLERYFVPEGEGRELEHARNARRLSVVAAVTPSGRAAIKRLLLDGKPVYDEPLF